MIKSDWLGSWRWPIGCRQIDWWNANKECFFRVKTRHYPQTWQQLWANKERRLTNVWTCKPVRSVSKFEEVNKHQLDNVHSKPTTTLYWKATNINWTQHFQFVFIFTFHASKKSLNSRSFGLYNECLACPEWVDSWRSQCLKLNVL